MSLQIGLLFFLNQNCNLDREVTSTTFLHNFGTLLTGYLFIKVLLKYIILPSWGIIFSKVSFFLCKFLLGKAISKILKEGEMISFIHFTDLYTYDILGNAKYFSK